MVDAEVLVDVGRERRGVRLLAAADADRRPRAWRAAAAAIASPSWRLASRLNALPLGWGDVGGIDIALAGSGRLQTSSGAPPGEAP
jgi:hypothetical protein